MLTPEQTKVLIFEVYRGKMDARCINESQIGVPEGMMRITGVAAQIGIKNRNGRIYTEENYLRHVAALQQDIRDGLYGELEHPEGFTINNNNISHKIEKLWYNPETREVMITLLLLDTEKGKIAQSIIKSGGKVHVSSRAMGSVNSKNEAVIDRLVTYDIVGTPGFKESELVLDENLKCVGKTSLCESYVLPVNEDVTSPKFNPASQNNISNTSIHNGMPNTNLSLLESTLAKSKGGRMNEAVTYNDLVTKVGPIVEKYISEHVGTVMENWILGTVMPLYENYCATKSLNESQGKTACSFLDFYRMVESESRRINEGQQTQNGQIVLTQEEQKCLQKLSQGQQLTQRQQQIAQQAQQKLQQNLQQQQQVKECQQTQNGEIVLSEEEQAAVKKLQEGQQLDQQEQQVAQQAIDKLQQQQKQQQKVQQQQELAQQDEQQLRESLNEKNAALNAAYKRLIESDESEEQKISEEIDQLKQEIQDVQTAIDAVTEGQQGCQQGSQKFQQAQQKIQQGQQLSEDDLEGLTQDELQQLIDQQKAQNEGGQYDDPNDAKVFEGQTAQKYQQIVQQLQQADDLTQQQKQVCQKLQQGQQLTQEEQKCCQQLMQQQGLSQEDQDCVNQQQEQLKQQQQGQQKPQQNKVEESAVNIMRQSGSLLEALQTRMHMNLEGLKN